jgi:hypothetical protein
MPCDRLAALFFLAAALLCFPGCAPVLNTTGRNAVGVGLGATSYESADPAEVAPDEVALPRTSGIRVSYARRLKGDSKLWLGPEAVLVLKDEAQT